VCFSQFQAPAAIAMSAKEHERLTNQFGGGEQYYAKGGSIIKDSHSKIIDKVPWRDVYGIKHQELWGHTEAWYWGREEAFEVIKKDLMEQNPILTHEQALARARQILPKGGGRELLMRELKKNYGELLSTDESNSIAEQVWYSHFKGDKNLMERLKNESPTFVKRIERSVAYPPKEYFCAKIKLDFIQGMRTSKLSGSRFVDAFSRTWPNYERWFVQNVANDLGIQIYNVEHWRTFGLVIEGKDYLVSMGSDKQYILNLAKKGNRVFVRGDVIKKLGHDPEASALIQQKIIQNIEDHISADVISKYSMERFKEYVVDLHKKCEQLPIVKTSAYLSYKNTRALINGINNRYNALLNKLPPKFRTPARAGVMAAVISGILNGYQVIQGNMELEEAALRTVEDSSLAATSIYLSDAFIQWVNGKLVITTVVKQGSALSAGFGAGLQLGVGTFIFDETRVMYNFIQGDIGEQEFIEQTENALIKSGAVAMAAYGVVALGFTPGGPVVMLVAMGTYLAVDKAISKYEEIQNRSFLYIEDVLGHLPLEMQKRITPFDRGNRTIPWERPDKITPWEGPNKVTPWEPPNRNTPWE